MTLEHLVKTTAGWYAVANCHGLLHSHGRVQTSKQKENFNECSIVELSAWTVVGVIIVVVASSKIYLDVV